MLNVEKVISNSAINGYYLIPKSEQTKLNNDIDFINHILKKGKIDIKNGYIPALNYDIDSNFKGPCNFSKLEVITTTPTGKNPKYKAFVRFATFKGDYDKDWGNDTFGEIYYLQNGAMGKARIIMWRDRALTVVHLKLVNNTLCISKIEQK